MGLVLHFSSGELVKIGDAHFIVTLSPPTLMREGEPRIPITNDWTVPLAEVRIRLAFLQHPGCLGLNFEAPRELVILRQAPGDIL